MKILLRLFLTVTVLTAVLTLSCANKNLKSDRKALKAMLEPTTTWQTYDDSRKVDMVFTSLINKMQKGYDLLLKGDYQNAYYEFDSILSDTNFINYPEYYFAKFYLAQTLYMLDVDYGALIYFTDILKKEKDKPYITDSLKNAISISQDLKDDGLILYLATILTPDRIPSSLREEFRFFIAKNFYLSNKFKNSNILFNAVTPDNRLYLLSQYYLGVTSVQEGNFKDALKHFARIASVKTPENFYEASHLRDLSNMNIARILFEAGYLQKSVEYYNKIDKASPIYPESLYESSWSLYNWGKFNAALSTLHSLQSPFYEITYFPRSILLKGAIFLELCMYKDAIVALKNLEEYYSELKLLMDTFYATAESREDYYSLLTGPENLRGASDANPYKKLFQLASANRDFLQMHKFVKKLNSELRILAGFRDNKRANILADFIEKKRNVVTKKAVNLAIEKIQLTKKAIQDYMKSADVIKLEITTAERKLLEDRVKGYGIQEIWDINIPPPVQSSVFIQDRYYFYKFEGEYWKDEVGYYLYNVKSQCVGNIR
jgi:hypothetical protein